MEIGVRELRDHLSRHLAEVRAGHAVAVTVHGRPIACIVPIDALSPLELRQQGIVRPASQRKMPASEPVPTAGSVSDLIDEQRR
ncbi:type II toxin-antitoxin system Phd/YefM family antitoxin [Nocardia mikamii]|uniref:type II toxin-antitoxin system Phd/YefM family antitoxin n=1 Tax=Nocardia mikamii TaxID=508464 RepID=UPI000A050B55|nr:type II toxin-antitoxin system prevent-host-death family antitoxin [Nocardia mikamii]